MDPHDLVSVYQASNSVEAEIVKNALRAEGIKAFVEGSNQAGEAGLAGFPVYVQVPAGEADRARKFIQHHRPQDHDTRPPKSL